MTGGQRGKQKICEVTFMWIWKKCGIRSLKSEPRNTPKFFGQLWTISHCFLQQRHSGLLNIFTYGILCVFYVRDHKMLYVVHYLISIIDTVERWHFYVKASTTSLNSSTGTVSRWPRPNSKFGALLRLLFQLAVSPLGRITFWAYKTVSVFYIYNHHLIWILTLVWSGNLMPTYICLYFLAEKTDQTQGLIVISQD